MTKEYRIPGAGESVRTQLETRWCSRSPQQRVPAALAVLVLVLQAACATGYPMGGRMMGSSYRYQSLTPRESTDAKRRAAKANAPSEDLEVANLRRAATLPWTDGGQCVVEEASQPWPVLAERCFHALDHERVQLMDTTGRCAVASAGAIAVGVGLCVLAAPEIVVGAVVIAGVVVVGFAIKETLEAYELSRGRPEVRPVPGSRPVPETRPLPEPKPAPQEPQTKRRPKPEPAGQDWPPPLPPEPLDRGRRRRCEAVPVPHLGGDDAHNKCADKFPPNRYPGMDARVDGKHFDALQVGVRVLWEIKTDQYDTYSDFIQEQVVRDQIEEFKEERDIARACGYGFRVGVSTEAHKAALKRVDNSFDIVVTGCKR